MSVDRTRAILGAVVKKFGQRVAGNATTMVGERKRIPIGPLLLDVGLGGGLAVGTTSLFYGNQGSGKTTTAMRAVGVFQGLCRRCMRPARILNVLHPDSGNPDDRWTAEGWCDCVAIGLEPMPPVPPKEKEEKPKDYRERCEAFEGAMRANSYEECVALWIDSENAFDAAWAVRQGMDPRRLMLVRPTTAEEGADVAKAFALSTVVDFIVIDSVAQMTPSLEVEESLEKWQQGLAARVMNKTIRALIVGAVQTRRAGGHGLTQILVNQTRMKIGVMYGDPTTVPCGLGQRFAAKAEIRFLSSKTEMRDEQYDTKNDVVAQPVREKISFKVTKNNTASMGVFEGDYLLVSRPDGRYEIGDFDDDEKYFKFAMHYLVTKEKGEGYVILGRSFPTQDALQQGLIDDRELRKEVRDFLFQKLVWGK